MVLQEILINLYKPSDNTPDQEKIEKITSVFNSLGIQEYVRQLIEAYHNLGISHLNAISVDDENKMELKSLAEFLLNRSH